MGDINVANQIAKPSAPSAGFRRIYPKAGGWYDLDENDVETLLTSPVFGRDQDSLESLGETTTTSTTDVIKLSFNPSGGPFTGTYRLAWVCEISDGTASRGVVATVNRTDAPLLLGESIHQPSSADEFISFSGVRSIVLSGVFPTFEMVFKRLAGSSHTAKIRNARFEWWRLS